MPEECRHHGKDHAAGEQDQDPAFRRRGHNRGKTAADLQAGALSSAFEHDPAGRTDRHPDGAYCSHSSNRGFGRKRCIWPDPDQGKRLESCVAACGRHFRLHSRSGAEQNQSASKGTGQSFAGNYELAVDSGVVLPRHLCRNRRNSLLDMQQSSDDSQPAALQSSNPSEKACRL